MKTTKTFLSLFCLLMISLGNAQTGNQTNYWYLGNNLMLNTSTYPPSVETRPFDSIGMTTGQEGTATISDDEGNLLFYTNGKKLFNKNDTIMQHGDSLMGGVSSSQSSLILPWPNRPGYYFVFTTDDFLNDLKNGLRYTVVSFCTNAVAMVEGIVDPTQKNVLLSDSSGEKLCAVHHANGTDYWVAAHVFGTNEFLVYLVDANGVHPPLVQSIGAVHADSIGGNACAIGTMKFSPDGSHIALAVGNKRPSFVELFRFNNQTGALSHPMMLKPNPQIGMTQMVSYYGVSFSPSGCKLFISDLNGTIWKYSVCPDDSVSVEASKDSLFSGRGMMTPAGLQLDKHGNIYVACAGYSSIGAIEDPDGVATYRDSIAYFPFPTWGHGLYLGLSYFVDGFGYPSHQENCTSSSISEIRESVPRSYPNPFQQSFFVEGDFKNAELFTYEGKQVACTSKQMMPGITEINCLECKAAGHYLLKVQTDDNVHVFKIIHE